MSSETEGMGVVFGLAGLIWFIFFGLIFPIRILEKAGDIIRLLQTIDFKLANLDRIAEASQKRNAQTPAPIATPPGHFLVTCPACRKQFAMRPGTPSITCPYCETVSNVE